MKVVEHILDDRITMSIDDVKWDLIDTTIYVKTGITVITHTKEGVENKYFFAIAKNGQFMFLPNKGLVNTIYFDREIVKLKGKKFEDEIRKITSLSFHKDLIRVILLRLVETAITVPSLSEEEKRDFITNAHRNLPKAIAGDLAKVQADLSGSFEHDKVDHTEERSDMSQISPVRIQDNQPKSLAEFDQNPAYGHHYKPNKSEQVVMVDESVKEEPVIGSEKEPDRPLMDFGTNPAYSTGSEKVRSEYHRKGFPDMRKVAENQPYIEAMEMNLHIGKVIDHVFLRGKDDVSLGDVADAMNVDVNKVHRLIKGDQDLSPDMALRLAHVFKVKADYLMKRQAAYKLDVYKESLMKDRDILYPQV